MRFRAWGMGLATALALFAAGGAQAQVPARGAACLAVEFAAVTDSPANARALPNEEGGTVQVDGVPVVASREVTGARATVVGEENAVLLSFAPEAARRMEAFTTQHLGARVAFIVDGRVVNIFTASGPIGGEGMQFSGMTTKAADTLAAGVNACSGPTAR